MMSSGLRPLLDESDALRLLHAGTFELEGRLVDASNLTLRGRLSLDGVTARCVYKPVRGERPLWDFPDGTLAGREVAAYLVSRSTGWGLVPPTVLRDGPLGPGACQLWIEAPDVAAPVEPLVGFVPSGKLPARWFPVAAARDEAGHPYSLAHADDPWLARLAAFDAVINNADRKGGHVLVGADGKIYGVDHGVCFHADDKLRTVLWGWAGREFAEGIRETLTRLAEALTGPLGRELAVHLSAAEITAVSARVSRLLRAGFFPEPSTDRPAIPWPPM